MNLRERKVIVLRLLAPVQHLSLLPRLGQLPPDGERVRFPSCTSWHCKLRDAPDDCATL
jgi:hypothetical protein